MSFENRRRHRSSWTGLILLAWLAAPAQAEADDREDRHSHYRGNCPPLVTKPYTELPLGAVKPRGWLREQLERMAEGMTGHLDELYPKVVGPRNGWLGGDGDGWERGPYWIDGLLPLAYLLDDEQLKDKVRPWIEWTLTHQREDGYLGPRPFETEPEPEPGIQKTPRADWWPKMVMLKILKNYYNATGDERVIQVLDRYFRYQLRELPEKPLGHWTFWAQRRGGDNLMVVLWLYNITGDDYLLELAELIHSQTYRHTERWLQDDSPLTRHYGMHCVNIAQGMKHPVVAYQLDGERRHLEAVDKAFADLDRNFGLPTGLYGADEPLNSNAPTTGSEFCTATEMMFSLEKMLEITGEVTFADRLERIAYNVLPTQATDDFGGRQYYSLVNQVVCARREKPAHLTDHGRTCNVFGLLTGYPCCTTNMHQSWPKLTQHLWMASSDDGLAALVYAPCTVTARVADGTQVTIEETTNYPFSKTIKFRLSAPEAVSFPLHLRIPTWCPEAAVAVNGETVRKESGGRIVKLSRRWQDGDRIELTLPMHLQQTRWHRNSAALERGPLVYALGIGERWEHVEGDDRYGDYRECYPTDPWNYALSREHLDDLDQHVEVHQNEQLADNPWTIETAPVEIRAEGHRLKEWKLINQTAGPLPASPVPVPALDLDPIRLIPYGCTTLRIAEFPVVKTGEPPSPLTAHPSASHVFEHDSVEALCDGIVPATSDNRAVPRFTWWDRRGGTEWVQYEFPEPTRVSKVSVLWYDDSRFGGCAVPRSWRLLYREGDSWKPVPESSEPEVARHRFNTLRFQPVRTDALRLEATLRDDLSGGILEWTVNGREVRPGR